MTQQPDDALIEAMARAMFKDDQINRLDIAKAALAVARPIIEAPLRAENEKLRADVALWAHKRIAHDSRLIERLRAENETMSALLLDADGSLWAMLNVTKGMDAPKGGPLHHAIETAGETQREIVKLLNDKKIWSGDDYE